MRKLFFLPLALVLVFLAVSGSSHSVGAIACGPYCDSPGGYTTPPATAIGTSCAIAQTNLQNQLKSYANSFCGTAGCQLVYNITTACHAVSGGYSITGYATFGCRDSTC
jgi:hypothetical protein